MRTFSSQPGQEPKRPLPLEPRLHAERIMATMGTGQPAAPDRCRRRSRCPLGGVHVETTRSAAEVDMAPETLSVLGIAGSLRRGSFNRGLIRAAVEVAPLGIRIVRYDLDDIPMFNADLEA